MILNLAYGGQALEVLFWKISLFQIYMQFIILWFLKVEPLGNNVVIMIIIIISINQYQGVSSSFKRKGTETQI